MPRPQVLAFLADIKEHPDEDGLRLILADWLEEFGDPADQARSDLIRCQIDHERLPAESAREASRPVVVRGGCSRNTARPGWGRWLQWLAAWAFRRGLLSVTLESSALRGQTLGLLAPSETWAWVDEVYLLDCSDAEAARLGRCPLLGGVLTLGFRRSALGPAGVQALGDLPLARNLRGLDLGHCPLGNSGTQALAASANLAGLRTLDLSGCGLSAVAGGHLSGSGREKPFVDLQTLGLCGNQLACEGIHRLTASGHWPRLRRLDLRNNQIAESGGRALARWPGVAGLLELNLADNQLGPQAAAALAECDALANIESLVLWGNPVGSDGAARLRERFGARVHVSPGRV